MTEERIKPITVPNPINAKDTGAGQRLVNWIIYGNPEGKSKYDVEKPKIDFN